MSATPISAQLHCAEPLTGTSQNCLGLVVDTVEGGAGDRCVIMACAGYSLDSERYVSLMEKLIGETEFLQDNPPKFVPQEDR